MDNEPVDIREVSCKTALSAGNDSCTLNPYVGCTHRCAYCYATYIAGYRKITAPWGSWVLVKRGLAPLLQVELTGRHGAAIFMSTTCDVYQPVEKSRKLTRACLDILRQASVLDPALRVTILTKSDLVLRDIDLLTEFAPGTVEVMFSVTTHCDDIARLVEPHAPSPSRRLAAAKHLAQANVRTGLMVCPVLPYIGERDALELVRVAARLGLQSVGFDHLNYLDRHVGPALEPVYRKLGSQAIRRLTAARYDPQYRAEIEHLMAQGKRLFALERRGPTLPV